MPGAVPRNWKTAVCIITYDGFTWSMNFILGNRIPFQEVWCAWFRSSPSPYVNQSLNLVRITTVSLTQELFDRTRAPASHSRKSIPYTSAVPSALHSASAASSGAS